MLSIWTQNHAIGLRTAITANQKAVRGCETNSDKLLHKTKLKKRCCSFVSIITQIVDNGCHQTALNLNFRLFTKRRQAVQMHIVFSSV